MSGAGAGDCQPRRVSRRLDRSRKAKVSHHRGTESTEKRILFGHRPTRTGTGRGCLARPTCPSQSSARCAQPGGLSGGVTGLGESLAQIDGLRQGRNQRRRRAVYSLPAGLSGNEKRQAFLCDLCASVVKGAFDRQRMLTTEAQRAQRRAFCLATDPHGQALDGGCLARPTWPGQSSARCAQPGVVEWRGYGLRRKMARIGVRGRGEEFSAAC